MGTEARTFVAGVMNKELDERLLPENQYTDATNVRISPSGGSNDGAVKNTKGNDLLGGLQIDGNDITSATTIGSFEDGANEKIYWFLTGIIDLGQASERVDAIMSYDDRTNMVTAHVISMQSPDISSQTTLNFNEGHRINSIDLVGDLLFWTDGYNPPRKINVSRGYAKPVASNTYMDTVPAEEFLVIKKPPSSSPSVRGTTSASEDNYMSDKFISFAYRYKYLDGEYSATSQFSEALFATKPFELNASTATNDGFENIYDGAVVGYNTGGSDVIGVDILYKELGDNIIKIAERINKEVDGVLDNSIGSFVFEGNKTFTLLDSAEILRLYDNVPHTAKAQTIMSNRLVYGNYTEGFDMYDSSGNEVNMDYSTFMSHSSQGFEDIPAEAELFTLTLGGYPENGAFAFSLNLEDMALKEGMSIAISFDLRSNTGLSNGTGITEVMAPTSLDFTYVLRQDFASPNALATDPDFIQKIGVAGEMNNIYYSDPSTPTACQGATLTEIINCSFPDTNGALHLYSSGRDLNNEAVQIISSINQETIYFVMPSVMRYVDDLAAPTSSGYDYATISNVDAQLISDGNGRSLKSRRGYEAAIVYMDDFGRSSSPQVSTNSGTRTVPSDSRTINTLSVSIPPLQNPPSWATRYKVVMKQTEAAYDTVYSHIYYKDPSSNATYFLLEGENAAKVEKGDELVVKRDSTGAITRLVETKVLDKTVEAEDFKAFYDSLGDDLTPGAGVYAKINTRGFATSLGDLKTSEYEIVGGVSKGWSTVEREMYATGRFGPFPDSVDAGSTIDLEFNFKRLGGGDGNNNCERRVYDLEKKLIASRSYDSFEEWWVGDDVQNVLDQGTADVGGDGPEIKNEMAFPGEVMTLNQFFADFPMDVDTNYWGWVVDDLGEKYLYVRGTRACGSSERKRSTVKGNITISGLGNEVVFETMAETALEDVWYENEQSFPIVGGRHTGNISNQTLISPATVQTSFFNCVSFGNGVESMKIKDSIIGNQISLGHRVHSTSAIDFKRAHRFADLTYSGVINDESNINKLNAFNGGLLNFKALEDSFGPIEIIDGRKTDILVLQEDKISVVLAGKNLLSMTDSVQGGALVSVPDVLSTQNSREDDYGISNNPESYCTYGSSKFFTDVKRGAVIELKGDQLSVISDAGMTTFFKDEFTADSDTFKIGGYDPYSQEYVLHNSLAKSAASDVYLPCGTQTTLTLEAGESVDFHVDFGYAVGDVNLIVGMPTGVNAGGSVTYNGVISGAFNLNGVDHTIVLSKDEQGVTSAMYRLYSSTGGTLTLDIPCVTAQAVTLIKVVLTDNSMDSTTATYNSAHTGYRRTNLEYTSPLFSTLNIFEADEDNDIVVNEFSAQLGTEGNGPIPLAGDEFFMYVTKTPSDTFTFNPSVNKMKVLRSNILYTSDPNDIDTLLSTSTQVTGVAETSTQANGDITFEGSFLAASTTDDYMYVIYDLRTFNSNWISYNASTALEACCNIECGPGIAGRYLVVNNRTVDAVVDHTTILGIATTTTVSAGTSIFLDSQTTPEAQVASTLLTVTIKSCLS